jgi:hypothetical protein
VCAVEVQGVTNEDVMLEYTIQQGSSTNVSSGPGGILYQNEMSISRKLTKTCKNSLCSLYYLAIK